jgi:hypothetical protein
VVWRGADEGHSGLAAAQVGDVGRHLLAGQLATFSGLGTLQTVKTAPGVDVSVESKQDCPISSHNVKYVGLAYFLTVGQRPRQWRTAWLHPASLKSRVLALALTAGAAPA